MKYNPYELECINKLTRCMNENKSRNNFAVDIGASYNSFLVDLPLRGILIDKDPGKVGQHFFPLFQNVPEYVTVDNVKDILNEHNIPKDFYILDIDIDSDDFFVLMSLLQEFRPKIIQTEINERIPPPVKFSIKPTKNFDWGWCHLYGYSISCLEDLMLKYNYSISSLTINNVILVRNDNGETPNIDEIPQIYLDGYLNNKEFPPPPWNNDVMHLQQCDTKEEVAKAWRDYFLNNKNPNNGKDQTVNVNNYVINESYDEYVKQYLKK